MTGAAKTAWGAVLRLTRPTLLAMIFLLASVGLMVGWAVVAVPLPVATMLFAGVAWLFLVRHVEHVALAVWVLLATDTMPLLSLDAMRVPGAFRPEDLLLAGLGAGAVVLWMSGHRFAPVGRYVKAASVFFVALWFFTFLTTWLYADVPAVLAALYGRDFLFFLVTAALVPIYLAGAGSKRRTALAVIAGGACTYALAQLLFQITGISLGAILHPSAVSMTTGVARPYQWSVVLVWLLVAPCLALGLADGVRHRRLWLGMAAVLLLGTALSQTRALYLGAIVAVVLTPLLMASVKSGRVPGRLYLAVAVGLVAAVAVLGVGWPVLEKAVTATVARASSVVAALGFQSSLDENWGYRNQLASTMLDTLGSDWPLGLGFLHPEAHPVPGLPKGSIRSDDMGMMQLLMTMGVAGVLGLVALLAALLWPVLASLLGGRDSLRVAVIPSADKALAVGCAASLAGGLAASFTIGTFIDAPAAMASGFLAGVLVATLAGDGRNRGSVAERDLIRVEAYTT